jgi:WD40 repeat protein
MEFLRHAKYNLYGAKFSPDGRWVVFYARSGPDRSRVYIAPFRERVAPGENEWIAVTQDETWNRDPTWSPSGNLVYFFSARDGSSCIWAQILDPVTKNPSGNAFPFHHFHEAKHTAYDSVFSVAKDNILFDMDEAKGNIWMMDLRGQR